MHNAANITLYAQPIARTLIEGTQSTDDKQKDLSERDICTKYINPALERAGWDMHKQVREEVSFTDGRIYVKGNLSVRGKRKQADYILYYKPNIPIAIIEAKENTYSIKSGIQQGLDYATILDIPSVFSSNGDGFYEHDRTCSNETIERELPLDQFPSPEELWQRYKRYKGIKTVEAERITVQDYFFDGTCRSPRYYQQIAINRSIEAIAKDQQRLLLTMALDWEWIEKAPLSGYIRNPNGGFAG